MNVLRAFACLGCVLLVFLAGCRGAPPAGVDPAYQVADLGMLGDWRTDEGVEIGVDSLGRAGFIVKIRSADDSATYRGHLLEVAGMRFIEVSVHQPDRDGSVPVYHYAAVERIGDVMTHRPIRADWLASASAGMPEAIYRSTAESSPGSGGVVVRERQAMLELLRKAASDPAALGPAERLVRVKN
ncbi:MAG: hypothetical protein KF787_11495 [Phycisphaeraceae bacterium]|nr:hypothetical protein [Phycisphaerae bacterium]MBX3393259.1 hypothetical protein [Phycisphaeraceae bacterium]